MVYNCDFGHNIKPRSVFADTFTGAAQKQGDITATLKEGEEDCSCEGQEEGQILQEQYNDLSVFFPRLDKDSFSRKDILDSTIIVLREGLSVQLAHDVCIDKLWTDRVCLFEKRENRNRSRVMNVKKLLTLKVESYCLDQSLCHGHITKEQHNYIVYATIISKSGAGQLDLLILDALKKVPPCLIGGLTLAQKNVTW
ncbi:hypothetical protein E2542_SST16930 [Spatholobus suberectus]|nr:hypothetical protein E2542_SST16930 [Spatholobus suberectus]